MANNVNNILNKNLPEELLVLGLIFIPEIFTIFVKIGNQGVKALRIPSAVKQNQLHFQDLNLFNNLKLGKTLASGCFISDHHIIAYLTGNGRTIA